MDVAKQQAPPASPLVTVARKPRREPEKWLFLLPAVFFLLVMSLGPLLFSVVLTFSTWILSKPDSFIEFSGLYNLQRLITDPRFYNALKNTATFVVVSVPVQYLIGLGLALLLNQEIKGRKVFRVLFFMPFMLSSVVVGFVIGKMLLNEAVGPTNHFLTLLGLPRVMWLSQPNIALLSLVAVDAWHSVAFSMIILLAGLQAMPQEPFESARIDGATAWQTFRYLTFPMLWPVSLTVLLLRSIATWRIADLILIMTGGGPGDVTESLSVYIYRLGIKYTDIGYATAMGQVLLWIVVIYLAVFMTAANRWGPKTE